MSIKGKHGSFIALALTAACMIFGTSTARAGCRAPANLLGTKPVALTMMLPSSDADHSIVGLWHNKLVMDNGDLLFQSTVEYHPDGLETESADIAPEGGNFCMGVWKYVGHDLVQIYHIAWLFNPDGSLGGYGVITQTNRLSRNGNSFTGTFDFAQYDNNGNFLGDVKGTTTARRIDFEHPFTIF